MSSRVLFFNHESTADYAFGKGHPMKPQRMRMLNSLTRHYGLYQQMDFFRPAAPSGDREMKRFHTDAYIDFISSVTPENEKKYAAQMKKHNTTSCQDPRAECPIFDGLFEYCQSYLTGSIEGAKQLNEKRADIAVNWAGGMSHARKDYASGFCFVNDCVLAILELLKHNEKVLYIDIDQHHCDGVEEAFYTTNRVMTLSFHKEKGFPGTGAVEDIGHGLGRGYAVNVPLKEGMDDATFGPLFQTVVTLAVQNFQPNAIVMQCGGGSLAGDRFGCSNLSIKGHAECLKFVKSCNAPLLVLGGGGFTLRNIPRLWLYETAVLLGKEAEISEDLPEHEYYQYYAPDFKLHFPVSKNMDNLNLKSYLEGLVGKVRTILQTKELP